MTHQASAVNPAPLSRTFKDSVFTNLFSEQRYALQLYQALHPEDRDTDADDIEIVTLQNVMTVKQHNDLGFIVKDRLLVLVEAQSTWSPNIALRALLYAAQTMKDYIHDHDLNIYGTSPVAMPVPELYVVYTGIKGNVPDVVTLSGALFRGMPSGVDSTVRVLRGDAPGIVGQYISFAQTLDARCAGSTPSEHVVHAAIRDCIEQGVLADYLREHEKEVVSIMTTLYDEEEVLRIYIEAELRNAREEAAAEGHAEGLQQGIAEGLQQGIAEGVSQGIAQGIAQGMAQGMAEGMAQGMAQGRFEGEARGIVCAYKELGASADSAIDKLVANLGMNHEQARTTVEELW